MKHNSIDNLKIIKSEVELINKDTKIIAVSKTFPVETINPLIDFGHTHFGENKVQEAIEKWTKLKQENKQIKLHLIGKLQTNKVKFVLPLFDYIHSLDNKKLAEKISVQQEKSGFKPKIFIQVNIGNEIQKNGINISERDSFLNTCQNDYKLDIIGLMCIPPIDKDTSTYFHEMKILKDKFSLKELSMGMSNDYKLATQNGSTFVRVGSKIFGQRQN